MTDLCDGDDWHGFAASALNTTRTLNSEVRSKSLLRASASRRFLSGFGREVAMGAIETTILVVVALVLGWGAVEIACKPCMESGRSAINRSLDPDYDPDDEIASSPYVEAPPQSVEKEEAGFPESPKKSYKVVKGEPSDI